MKSCRPKTMKGQLLRGVAGLGLLVAAGFAYREYYALSFVLVLLSLIPLRGCPVCWIVDTCEAAGKPAKKPETPPENP